MTLRVPVRARFPWRAAHLSSRGRHPPDDPGCPLPHAPRTTGRRAAMQRARCADIEARRRLKAQGDSATMPRLPGGVPEWLKGADCKSVGAAYLGSNPSSPTTYARLAQQAEHLHGKEGVRGSNPRPGSSPPACSARVVRRLPARDGFAAVLPTDLRDRTTPRPDDRPKVSRGSGTGSPPGSGVPRTQGSGARTRSRSPPGGAGRSGRVRRAPRAPHRRRRDR